MLFYVLKQCLVALWTVLTLTLGAIVNEMRKTLLVSKSTKRISMQSLPKLVYYSFILMRSLTNICFFNDITYISIDFLYFYHEI